ncbi:hypothetical protein G6F22_015156 [Rhizopus arrhizus]|nr:hypothetical protein G6F22_015156 [Rhizopus arrhizus]
MACDQQEPLAALGQAAQLAAIVRGLAHHIAVVTQQLDNLIEEVAPARGDARDILEQDDLDRVVLPGFEAQPDAAQRQFVECLVLGSKAARVRQQARKALARRGQEQDVRVVAPSSCSDICGTCFDPPGRGLMAMERDVLVAAEHVTDRATHARETVEVGRAGGIYIDAAQADHLSL